MLGAGAYLAPRGQARAFFTHAGNSSTDQAWETPAALLEALHGVFGRFDLDPCAPRKSRTRVRARTHYTDEDDGLSLAWHGTVFVNPPYGRTLAAWVAKARQEAASGRPARGGLAPGSPRYGYWHEHIAGPAAVYFLRGRLRFSGSRQSAPFPSALAVWGAGPGCWRPSMRRCRGRGVRVNRNAMVEGTGSRPSLPTMEVPAVKLVALRHGSLAGS